MENISTRQIMVRRPFRRILPNGYKQAVGVISGSLSVNEPLDNPTYQIITQMDFLREFEPSGHAINDPLVYPDRLRQDPETKEWFRESVMCFCVSEDYNNQTPGSSLWKRHSI
jgi:hypothetical protein